MATKKIKKEAVLGSEGEGNQQVAFLVSSPEMAGWVPKMTKSQGDPNPVPVPLGEESGKDGCTR